MIDELDDWLASAPTRQFKAHLQRMRDTAIAELVEAVDMPAGATARRLGQVKSLEYAIACLEDAESYRSRIAK